MPSQSTTALVTGVAGFIGSHLAEALLDAGAPVVGVDAFTDYYPGKRDNLRGLIGRDGFRLVEGDLRTLSLEPLVDGADVIYHLAGQPGVRSSWADGFTDHLELNLAAGQRLLEVVRRVGVERFVYASSSSVYGNAAAYPCMEGVTRPRPHSPYGVTKLAVEQLCRVYAENFGVPTVSLRYFTVYGPRQRPDMALHRLIEAALGGPAFHRFGDGTQIRDFTYVADVVEATRLAGSAELEPGEVVNVAGGAEATLDRLIELVERSAGPVAIVQDDAEPGDVARTGGSIERAGEILGWSPRTDLESGIVRQVEWHRSRPRP